MQHICLRELRGLRWFNRIRASKIAVVVPIYFFNGYIFFVNWLFPTDYLIHLSDWPPPSPLIFWLIVLLLAFLEVNLRNGSAQTRGLEALHRVLQVTFTQSSGHSLFQYSAQKYQILINLNLLELENRLFDLQCYLIYQAKSFSWIICFYLIHPATVLWICLYITRLTRSSK